MLEASYISYTLDFLQPAGTSRGVLYKKPAWFIRLKDESHHTGYGEYGYIPGLSVEPEDEIEEMVDQVCSLITRGKSDPRRSFPGFPGLQFALESAMLDLEQGGERILFPGAFVEGKAGIPINGLIWMGNPEFMIAQIREKTARGFRVLKLKVGSLMIEEELNILQLLRREFKKSDLEIRLDANGAWNPENALDILEMFARYDIHSIEQPVQAGQWKEMARICRQSAIPVALDEELIGISGTEHRINLLEAIRPAYIILKPGLAGGFGTGQEWMDLANERNIGWWVTSSLESSIGLNALAQWTASLDTGLHQGLGTGRIYSNNISSPLVIRNESLWYDGGKKWDLSPIEGLFDSI